MTYLYSYLVIGCVIAFVLAEGMSKRIRDRGWKGAVSLLLATVFIVFGWLPVFTALLIGRFVYDVQKRRKS